METTDMETHQANNTEWLETLDLDELAKLADAVAAARDAKKREAIEAFRRESEERAKKLGLDLTTFFSAPEPRKPKRVSTLPAKYRGPNGEEWNGRGKGVPPWMEALLDAGKTKEECINPEWSAARA